MVSIGSSTSYGGTWAVSRDTGRSTSSASEVPQADGSATTQDLKLYRYRGLSDDVTPELRQGLVVSVTTGRSAVAAAYRAAGDILDTLDTLRSRAVAARNMFVSRNAGDDGRFALDVEATRLVARIDQHVASAQVGDINFIASGEAFLIGAGAGGAVQLSPQPLDSEALGLGGLSLASDADAEMGLEALDNAYTLAVRRTRQLAELSDTLESAEYYDQAAQGFAFWSASVGWISAGYDAMTRAYQTVDLYDIAHIGRIPRGYVANLWA